MRTKSSFTKSRSKIFSQSLREKFTEWKRRLLFKSVGLEYNERTLAEMQTIAEKTELLRKHGGSIRVSTRGFRYEFENDEGRAAYWQEVLSKHTGFKKDK